MNILIAILLLLWLFHTEASKEQRKIRKEFQLLLHNDIPEEDQVSRRISSLNDLNPCNWDKGSHLIASSNSKAPCVALHSLYA